MGGHLLDTDSGHGRAEAHWRQVVFWAPKGGIGATTIALNTAAAACEHGRGVAYADLDPRWGDATLFFGGGQSPLESAGTVRAMSHPCGLTGFVAADDAAVRTLARDLRGAHDLVVLDWPSAVVPATGLADLVVLVVGQDLSSLRRARAVVDTVVTAVGPAEMVCVARDGAVVTIEDCEAVLGLRCRAAFDWEPALVAAGDRGNCSYGLRRSRWAESVRELAAALCRGATPLGDGAMSESAGRIGVGELGDVVRRRILAGTHAGLPLRERIRSIVAEEVVIPEAELDTVAEEIAAVLTGLGALEPLLADPTVCEVMVNGPDAVWVERRGRLQRTSVVFPDDEAVLALVDRILSPAGLRVDAASPTVDARLADGSRVHAVIPPLARCGPVLTIRRFVLGYRSLGDLVACATLTEDEAGYLAGAVRERRNVLVSGGTSSGKTTLLNVLAAEIEDVERLITIEDAAELALAQPHVVALQARPPSVEGTGEVTVRDLVRNALRMRPDRILVGEVRGAEAVDMVAAMSTGHRGSLSTIHADSPASAMRRLETMILLGEPQLPAMAVRRQMADAVDVVVQMKRLGDGRRVLTETAEVVGADADGVALRTVSAGGTTL